MKIILLYEMNHEIEGLFHDVHLGGLLLGRWTGGRDAKELCYDGRLLMSAVSSS
jgi:hypothetical protein